MEAAMGGESLFNMDGDWESFCGILSIDQDSDFLNLLGHHPHHHHPSSEDNQGLLSLLMDDAHDSIITSPFAQYYTQEAPPNLNITTTSLGDLSNNSSCHFVKPSYHDNYDQISPVSSLNFPIIKGSNAHQHTKRRRGHLGTRPDQILVPKKKGRVSKNLVKVKRKSQEKKSILEEAIIKKVEGDEEDRKSICNESNASEESSIAESINKKRASRGSATDPQSLYARRRRERINERLKILQTLVPNGTKVDISTMLEEAVNYVKFLQLQIKLLSSDEMWMYAPLAYNGFDVGHYMQMMQ